MTENSRASLTEALPEHLQKIMSEAQALKTSTTASRVSSPLPQEEDVLVDRRHSRRLSQVFTSDDLGSDQTDQTEEVEEQEEQTKIEQFDFSQQPKYIVSGHLRRYQLDGLAWLANLYTKNISGILADEMGLGKTLQSISLFAWIYEQYQIRGPHMVVAPKSTLGQWHDEMAKWCPFLTPLVLIGDKEERAEILKRVRAKDFDVLITSNEVCKIEKSTLLRIHWRTLVVDEGHRLKNPESETSKVLSRFKTHFRLLLTGTPLQNNLHELWALLNFIMPETFQTAESFTAIARQREGESPDLPVKRLHAVLRPFILRRLKADVETLPPKREINVLCGLSATQRDLYRGILAKDISSLVGDGVGRSRLRNIVMQLRKCVNHPYLFSGIEPGPPYVEGEHLVKSSGKLMLLDALLTRLKDEGSRVLLFSQMTSVLNILEDYCHLRNHQYVRLDGQTSLEDRNRYMRRFNAPNSPIFIFLLSTRAGGLGLNLASADTVVLYDIDWNPQVDAQAIDRSHRLGQTRPVNVYRLLAEHTIDEKIYERAKIKQHLDSLIIQAGRLVGKAATPSKQQLRDMIHFGAQVVFDTGDQGEVTDEQLDAMLQRGEELTKAVEQTVQREAGRIASSLLERLGDDGTLEAGDSAELYRFEGTDYSKIKQIAEGLAAERHHKIHSRRGRAHGGRPSSPPPRARRSFPTLRRFRTSPQHRPDFMLFPKPFYALQTKVERTLSAIENKMQQDPDLQFDTTLHCDPTLPGLNEKELKTFKGLLEVGSPFHRWNRREFQALFGALCELDIKEDWEELAERVRAKGCTQSDEDIRRYADAILKNIGTFTEADRMRTRFQKGQQRRKKHAAKIRTLRRHVAAYADPFAMALPTVTRNKNSFNEVEDRFLLAQTVKEGYGEWAQVLAAARLSPLFTFDWWFKSRTPGEINRRVEALVRGLQKMEVSVGVRRTAGTAGLETKTARPKKKRQLTLDAFKSDKK